jgi:hypothetical protein
LVQYAARAQKLLIATDNDREGENIGFEVYNVCRRGAVQTPEEVGGERGRGYWLFFFVFFGWSGSLSMAL